MHNSPNSLFVTKKADRPWPSLTLLLPAATIALLGYIVRHDLVVPTLALAAAIGLFFQSDLYRLGHRLPRRWRHPLVLQGIFFAALTSLLLLDLSIMPAQAQFMRGAEQFLGNFISQAGIPTTVNTLIFGTLRGLFLLYLAISIIRVVQAARNDEDWQTLARTPLIIVVSVVVADVLTGLIIGNQP